jgi:hypothetical protein
MTHETVYLAIEAEMDNFQELGRELRQALDETESVYIPVPKYQQGRRASEFFSSEVIVSLVSAGAFTSVFKLLESYLSRNHRRELKIKRGQTTITIKGHSLPEEQALTAALFPELSQRKRTTGQVS